MLEARWTRHFFLTLLLVSACQPGDDPPAARDGGESVQWVDAEGGSGSSGSSTSNNSQTLDAAIHSTPDVGLEGTPGQAEGGFDAGLTLDATPSADASQALDAAQTSDAGPSLCPLAGAHRIYAGSDYTCAILKKYGMQGLRRMLGPQQRI